MKTPNKQAEPRIHNSLENYRIGKAEGKAQAISEFKEKLREIVNQTEIKLRYIILQEDMYYFEREIKELNKAIDKTAQEITG